MTSLSHIDSEVFLTGASGFLGAHMLAELLSAEVRVHCLVRAPDVRQGNERLQRTLRHYGLWREHWRDALRAVPGDLEKPLLGIPREIFIRLSNRIGLILHGGANVNYAMPYGALHKANVQGTQEVIRLAGRRARLVYISTLRLFDARTDGTPVREQDPVDETATLHSGYSQSKWIAEKLVRRAGDQGTPQMILRPGLIWGGAHGGAVNADDAVSRLIRGCVALGRAPISELQVNITATDYAVKGMLRLAGDARAVGGVFHLVNDEPTPCSMLFEGLRELGHPLEMLPYDEWTQRLRDAVQSRGATYLLPLLQYFHGDLPAQSRRRCFDSQTTRERLGGAGIECPRVDPRMIQDALLGMARSGLIPETAASHQQAG